MIIRHGCVAALLLAAGAAGAQVPPAELGQRYVPAPWWMREPVIVAIGQVRTELPANRARFDAAFAAVERTAEAATAAAAAKVRALDAVLRAEGPERVRLETSFTIRPLYEQYREKDGTLVDNERADKIDRYEARAQLVVEVRDVTALERAYAAVLSAKPSSVGRVSFRLEPDNATKTFLATEAVKDAARRARGAVEAAGARLGPAKVIDPTARACQTDVLAGWPNYIGGSGQRTEVSVPTMERQLRLPAPAPPYATVTGERRRGATEVDAVQVTLQPPRLTLDEDACVIYALPS